MCVSEFLYLLVRWDGDGEHFDSVMLGFVSSLLHASTGLFVTSNRMAISDYHDVLVLVVVGASVCKMTHKHTFKNNITLFITESSQAYVCVCVCMCVLFLPNEQLSKAPLDGTVSICAFANEINAIDVILQRLPIPLQVTQLSYKDDFVTVVQRSWVPRQDAVTWLTTG